MTPQWFRTMLKGAPAGALHLVISSGNSAQDLRPGLWQERSIEQREDE